VRVVAAPERHGRSNAAWYVLNDADTVLIFIHGIFSDSASCWRYQDPRDAARTTYWPDLLAADRRLQTPSIFLGGYTTAISAGDLSLSKVAREVLDALQRTTETLEPPPLDKRNLVFVCHSTGGIVARYILERHREEFKSKVIGLVLLASPSLGSIYANKLEPLARFYNQQLGLQLQWGGESLEDLDGRFKDLVNNRSLNLIGAEAYEHYFILRRRLPEWLDAWLPNRRKVVSELSAGRYFGQPRLLPNTDHFSIAKPDSLTHVSHEFLIRFLNQELGKFAKLVAQTVTSPPVSTTSGGPVKALPVRTNRTAMFESVKRLSEASSDTLDKAFQPKLLHRTVTVDRPDAELLLHEELVNVSVDPLFDLVRVIASDAPVEFSDLQAKARLTIDGETSDAAISAIPSSDRRTFRVKIGFKGRAVKPGELVTIDWWCRCPGSVRLIEDYWVFPCLHERPVERLVSEVSFSAEPLDHAFYLIADDGDLRQLPTSPRVNKTDGGSTRYVYQATCSNTKDMYLMTWRLAV